MKLTPIEGFALYNNIDKPIYEFFSDYPEKAHRFADLMKALSNRSDLAIVHTVNGFDWGQLESGTIVDVSALRPVENRSN